MLLNDDYLLDIFNANSDDSHVYDLAYHGVGTYELPNIDFQSAYGVLGSENGYQYLTGASAVSYDEAIRVSWLVAPRRNVGFTVWGNPEPPTLLPKALLLRMWVM